MSTHNIGFYEDLTKIIFQLSSNTHLISSSIYSEGQQGPVQGNKEALATVTGIVDGTGSVGAALGQVSMNTVLKTHKLFSCTN